ncbi:MAG TPA: sugar transferase [Ktedonosporobacter sp.]|jgi:lipopolysaccharide/colanic/teichoic acid biosynthesis glycosyltransferase|nr:sugar transferase [Ktedonosporobacter sp.]
MHTKVEYHYLSIRLSQFYLIWRAMMDVTFGLGGLIFICCILPFLALLIYLDSPGPIFYTQERVGYKGRKFTVYKFRSMTNGAERRGQAIWAVKGDPRVTRIGRFLRASHLDELPQVLNILRGEMSLIGPRPERPEYAAELEAINPLYRQRLSIKPGLTGWAQVNYGYGATSKDELEKLEFDLYYIQYQSFLLDIRILLRTVREVVLCHGI